MARLQAECQGPSGTVPGLWIHISTSLLCCTSKNCGDGILDLQVRWADEYLFGILRNRRGIKPWQGVACFQNSHILKEQINSLKDILLMEKIRFPLRLHKVTFMKRQTVGESGLDKLVSCRWNLDWWFCNVPLCSPLLNVLVACWYYSLFIFKTSW